MLCQLDIKNYALIQELSLKLDKGLNIITGETGAGKSILLGALGLALGDRADTKTLFNPEKKCVVEATFSISNYHLQKLFKSLDIDYAPLTLIRREITPYGKSRAFVNDTPIVLQNLKILTNYLINIHSQHDNQKILQTDYQLNIIDTLANNQELIYKYKEAFSSYKKTHEQLNTYKENQEKLQQEFEFNSFQLNELENAQLDELNIEETEAQFDTLNHAEAIKKELYRASNILDGNELSVISIIQEAYTHLNQASKYSNTYVSQKERLESLLLELKDLQKDIELKYEQVAFNNTELENLRAIIDQTNALLKKHLVKTPIELIQKRNVLREKIQSVTDGEAELRKLENQLFEDQKTMKEIGLQLTKARKHSAKHLQQEVEKSLNFLGMPNGAFTVELTEKTDYSINGNNEIKFLFSANKGFALQAIQKIASGGELSRVMLSLQSTLAKSMALPSLVLDEIDTGISGEIAAKVSEVLKTISDKHQLIVITHLPQIAAKAEKHFFVYKQDKKNKTETKIASLNESQHVKAIARMLSGEHISEESLNNAKILISQ